MPHGGDKKPAGVGVEQSGHGAAATVGAADDGLSGAAEFRRHWPTLVGATIAASIGTIGFQAYTNGAFVPDIIKDTGFTREQVSLATLCLSGAVAVIAPFMGQVIDSIGARRVIALCVVGEAVGFTTLSFIPAQFGFFAAAMVLLGILGVGTTPPSFARLVSSRFDRRRGLALGIMISGLGVTAISAPLWATAVIGIGGWRVGYRVLAALVLILGLIGLLVMRLDVAPVAAESRAAVRAGNWDALRRPLFWIVLACFAGPALFGGGYLFHLITLLRERGYTLGDAAKVQSLIGASIIAGRLLSGAAMDRFFAPFVAAFAFALAAVGTVMLMSDNYVVLAVGAVAVGLPIGAELDILAYTVSRYFGIQSFGRCYSLAYSTMIFAGGASPVLIAHFAPSGDYTTSLTLSAVGLAACAIGVACLPRFRVGPETTMVGAVAAS